jgi:hemerythrin-like metal-binding protein
MPIFTWNDNLSVGIDSIDRQHMKLVEMINEFYERIKDKSSTDLIANLIKNMREYALHHFATEEKLFMQFNYPEADGHVNEHKKFVDKVMDLEERYKSGSVILSFEITNFLKDWLVNHIQGTDKEYANYFIDRGVK